MSIATPVQNGTNGTAGTAAIATNGSGKPSAAPEEVGWLFVPQYYTFLHDDPSKLHCFYSKRSTFVHGTEREEVPLCIGQQQIHEKIVSLGFENAKVYVCNVDSQASANGGIVIQVLGEITNKGGPWRKFAQTFFLAEQPNGYFVLNDIFRYLKDEDEEDEEEQEQVEAVAGDVPSSQQTSQIEAPAAEEHNAALHGAEANSAAPVSVSTAPLDEVAEAEANGTFKAEEPTPASPSEVGMDKKVTLVDREEAPAVSRGQAEAEQAVAQPADASAPTPALNGAKSSHAPTPAETAAASAPAKPKTWANLAASNATKWGTAVNAESRGVSSARPTSTNATPAAPQSSQRTAAPSTGAAAGGHGRSNAAAQVFIKNVIVDNMPAEGLQAALEAKFGPMKECAIVASKAVAFGEFATPEVARKAIQLSAAEGGIKVGKNGWAVLIEEKRKPADRNGTGPSAGRGGAAGGARGGRGAGRAGAPGGGRGGRPAAAA